ncbi:MAG: fructose-bisphosphatase class III, partial [Clostridia bacterium]|nr:fructose-bisphosphatase class III [Clostridia bacterium]
MNKINQTQQKYLRELARSYPDRESVRSEIINLSAILELPKGTEHFLSDLHGEHEAFTHIRRNASGVIKRKVDSLFENSMTARERADLCTLIYYPEQKLSAFEEEYSDERHAQEKEERYRILLVRLCELCRLTASKYTRSKVRKHVLRTGGGYDYIIDELLSADFSVHNKEQYYDNIIDSIVRVGAASGVIISLCRAIGSLVVDHLHIVGDIYDRGPRADLILDELMTERSIDIQWGNHDVLWLGAAAGSRTCIATVLNNSITYKNLDVVEMGYGISLRPLSLFASEVYADADVSGYMPKGNSGGDILASDDEMLIARMHKAISIIQFKLEGQTIRRNPEFRMEHRLLLDKIDYGRGTVSIEGVEYKLRDTDFPTIDPADPYKLTEAEREVMRYLKLAFMRSERLTRHARFLYEKGEMYTVYNGNLLFHGCIPMHEDGSFMSFPFAEGRS